MKKILKNELPKGRIALLIIIDIIMIQISCIGALWIRYDMSFMNIDRVFLENLYQYAPWNTALTILCFWMCGMYTSLWSYASVIELLKLAFGSGCAILIQVCGMSYMGYKMPRSYGPMSFILLVGLIAVVRFSYRVVRVLKIRCQQMKKDDAEKSKVMVIGAGESGAMIIREYRTSEMLNTEIACVIDDDEKKWGRSLHSYPIVGGREEIFTQVKKHNIDKIIIAMPTAKQSDIRDILNICKETKCELLILPGIYQLVNGDVRISKLRKVEIEDLLGREQVKVDNTSIGNSVQGKVVLVTGGGGSIGSELCRQIAKCKPKQLIIFDIYENNAYQIQQELIKTHPELYITVLIGSVRNEKRINSVFSTYRPQLVYHAAAHKHVPLMEESPNEAIKNNVFGTYKTALAADRFGCERFVLISTDKAVNPTNIMGASKRICEMLIQSLDKHSNTEYVAVRFGNVLGSNGSVIPLFKKQIEQGGPVTVTHPDILRYFMTIPEAVSLVLQAGVYAKGGEIFVLEMGEPVRIVDMAKNLIRLSGLRLGEDIEITFTGLRPGEKLYEEKLMAEEGLKETDNHLIHIGMPIPIDQDIFKKQLAILREACEREDDRIKELVAAIVPTYQVGNTVSKKKRYSQQQLKDLANGIRG